MNTPEDRIRRLMVDRNYTHENLMDDILASHATVGETGKLEHPPCEDVEDEVDCLTCEDNGFTITPGGMRIPCFDCKMGDLYLYHEREQRLKESVASQDHADLSEEFEDELARYDAGRD